jgi:hypothetical protein
MGKSMTVFDEEEEGFNGSDWAHRYGQAIAAAPTREVALLITERGILEANIQYGYKEIVQKLRDQTNQMWDRKDEEAREPHGPRLPMTPLDSNTVYTVAALFKQLPFKIHILWYPRTKILGCVFEDRSFMNLEKGPSTWGKIIEILEGNKNIFDVRSVLHIPYASDGPANAPFEIAEDWLQENGYWFFRA